MTPGRVREIMATKKFSTNSAGLMIFYYDRNTVIRRQGEQDFRVCVQHPIRGWEDTYVVFHNPVAAATYAVRHVIPEQPRYTGR